jgi:hypothetical protein
MAGAGGGTKVVLWVPTRSNCDEDGIVMCLALALLSQVPPKKRTECAREHTTQGRVDGRWWIQASSCERAFSMPRLLEKEMDWSLRWLPLTGFMKSELFRYPLQNGAAAVHLG